MLLIKMFRRGGKRRNLGLQLPFSAKVELQTGVPKILKSYGVR
jgi:hypothetical protein